MFMTSNQIKKQRNTKSKINQITCAQGCWAVRWQNREVQITCAGGCGGHKWRSSDICCTSQASLWSRTENSSSYHLPPYLRLFIFTLVWFFFWKRKRFRLHRFHMSQGENYFWSLNPFPVALLRLPPKCLSGSPALAIFKPGKSCAQLRCTFQLSFFLQRQNLSSEFLHFCHSHRLLAVASCVAQLLWRCPDCSICHNVKVVLSLSFGTI